MAGQDRRDLLQFARADKMAATRPCDPRERFQSKRQRHYAALFAGAAPDLAA